MTFGAILKTALATFGATFGLPLFQHLVALTVCHSAQLTVLTTRWYVSLGMSWGGSFLARYQKNPKQIPAATTTMQMGIRTAMRSWLLSSTATLIWNKKGTMLANCLEFWKLFCFSKFHNDDLIWQLVCLCLFAPLSYSAHKAKWTMAGFELVTFLFVATEAVPASMTRIGVISPLWQNCKGLRYLNVLGLSFRFFKVCYYSKNVSVKIAQLK